MVRIFLFNTGQLRKIRLLGVVEINEVAENKSGFNKLGFKNTYL